MCRNGRKIIKKDVYFMTVEKEKIKTDTAGKNRIDALRCEKNLYKQILPQIFNSSEIMTIF